MGGILGGSKQKSESKNVALGDIKGYANPMMGYARQGAEGLMGLLGGDATGFQNFKNATGFDWAAEQGSRGVTGNAAAKGLLRSGSTGKSLVEFGNNIQNQFANNYMDKLLGVAGLGNQAAGILAGAGQQTNSSGKTKPGIGGLLGTVASSVAMSDRRTKSDIVKVSRLSDGLNVYSFRYTDDNKYHIGVMADEVAEIRPEALGPVINGYQTVNYDKIW